MNILDEIIRLHWLKISADEKRAQLKFEEIKN